MNNYSTSNLKNMIFLTYFIEFLGLSPKYDKSKKTFVDSKIQVFCGMTFVSGIILSTLVLIPNRLKVYPSLKTMRTVMDVTCGLTMISVNASTIISTTYYHRSLFLNMFNNLIRIEKKLTSFGLKFAMTRWSFYLELLATHSVMIFINSYNVYYWFFAPVRVNQFYLVENIERYHISVTVIVMSNVAKSLKYQLDGLNLILSGYTERKRPISFRNIDRLRSTYFVLMEQIRSFNRIFGSVMFLLFVHVMVSYLNFFNGAVDMEFILGLRQSIKYIFLAWIFILLVSMECKFVTYFSYCRRNWLKDISVLY